MSLEEEAHLEALRYVTRRHFLRDCTTGLGAVALAGLLGDEVLAAGGDRDEPLAARAPHFAPRAKRVIFLHMAGAPSQLELFDHKPALRELHGKPCPQSLLDGERFAFIEGTPEMLGPQFAFARHGKSGIWVSEMLPHFARVVDRVTVLKAMYTEQFNHAPAQFLMQTGSARQGFPSLGAWVTYGLGTENRDLPGFVVLVSGGKTPSAGKSVWGSGFLPSVYQGVQCRSEGDPVLYVSDPAGMSRDLRRRSLDTLNSLNRLQHEAVGDPETLTRIAQFELAFRMQMSVPEVMDIAREPEHIHTLYGTEPGKASFANNCLLARRLVERGVRFVQLYHWGWDSHGTAADADLLNDFPKRCRHVDQPMSALLLDLERRGLLDDTLVVWGGEFGRTPMRENRGGKTMKFVGRDHHPHAFTMWMAGGGVRPGHVHGETDELGYRGVKDRVHVHDLQATMLHLLGFDHEKLTYRFQGRDFRLTDVHGRVVREILA